MKQLIWILLSIGVAVAAMAFALWHVDLVQVGRAMAGANYVYLLPYVALLAVYYALTAFNWALLLQPVGRFTVRQVAPAMMVGFAGNNLLPMRLGELVRAVVFARQHSRPTGAVLASLLLERILDVLTVLVLYVLSLFVLRNVPSAVATGARLFALALLPIGAAIGAFLLVPAPFLKLWHVVSVWLPARWRTRGTRLIEGVLHGLTALRSPTRLAALAGNSLLKWFCSTASIWLVLQAFHTGASVGVAMVVLVVTALAIALPNTPGYVGTLQAAFVIGLSPFGISPDVAFAASIFHLVANWVPVTLAGIVSVGVLGLHFSELRREMEVAEHEVEEADHEAEEAEHKAGEAGH